MPMPAMSIVAAADDVAAAAAEVAVPVMLDILIDIELDIVEKGDCLRLDERRRSHNNKLSSQGSIGSRRVKETCDLGSKVRQQTIRKKQKVMFSH